MSGIRRRKPIFSILAAAVVAAGAISLVYGHRSATEPSQPQQPVTVAYQTGVDPTKVAQADGGFEKATGTPIRWKKFDSGADVLAAVASGDVSVGNIGSSPFAAAASRGLPVEVFYIADILGGSEALVTRPALRQPQDLAGKKIAVPFVSTTHYSLLAALRHWQINPDTVDIVNLRPSEIAAAWQRGDIDGAYVWEPALGSLKTNGRVLVDSAQVGKWGAPTYDLWIVRRDFAEKHPDFLVHFVQAANHQVTRYNRSPQAYTTPANTAKIAALTGSRAADIPLLLAGNRYPSLKEQADILDNHFADDIKKTAVFLKEQKKIDTVRDDYAAFVTSRFVREAQE